MRTTQWIVLGAVLVGGAAGFVADRVVRHDRPNAPSPSATRAVAPMSDAEELESIKKALIIEYTPPPPPPPLYDNPQAARRTSHRVHGRSAARTRPMAAPKAAPKTAAVKTEKPEKQVAFVRPAPIYISGNAEADAPKPEDAVRLALRSKRLVFEHCYELELRKQAIFSGFVVLSMSVSASGAVTHTRVVEGSKREAAVGSCIASKLRTLKLPDLAYDADLILPIRLDAKVPDPKLPVS
jgi:hypothetical protein